MKRLGSNQIQSCPAGPDGKLGEAFRATPVLAARELRGNGRQADSEELSVWLNEKARYPA